MLLVAARSANHSQDETTAVSSNRKIPSHRKMRVSGHETKPSTRKRGHTAGKSTPAKTTNVFQQRAGNLVWSSMTEKRDARPIARLITASTINGA